MQFLLKFLTRLPLPVLYELSRALFRGAYYVFRWRRPLASTNLRNAFPEKSEPERAAILKQSYRNLADLIVETLYGYGASAADMQRRVRVENPEVDPANTRSADSPSCCWPRISATGNGCC